jgi:hypothetical protein
MSYAVMIRCNDGTQQLRYDTGSSEWVRRQHVITWTVEQTRPEAEQTRAQLLAGRSREIHDVWIEER